MYRSAQRSIRRWAKGALARRGRDVVFVPAPLGRRPDARLAADFDLVLSHFLLRRVARRAGAEALASFIQIGAGDGVLNDPLHPYLERRWLEGALIEPLPEPFASLQARWRLEPRLLLRRAAVAARSGSAPIFRVAPHAPGPAWIHQLASFERGMVAKHAEKVPGLERFVVEEEVPCVTFGEILAELGRDRVDVLVVDAEGMDDEILGWYDLERRLPSIVRFEHVHLDDRVRDRRLEQLIALGYRIALEPTDITAYRSEGDPEGAPD